MEILVNKIDCTLQKSVSGVTKILLSGKLAMQYSMTGIGSRQYYRSEILPPCL